MSADVKCIISGTAKGGREDHVKTGDGAIDLALTPPKALAGSGTGRNPEQHFASGYAPAISAR